MGWAGLLQDPNETIVFPWVRGRSVRSKERTWTIEGELPILEEWYEFKLSGRKAQLKGAAQADPQRLVNVLFGYLVGDRLVPDEVRCDPDPKKIVSFSERVHIIDQGLDRFVRISAGRTHQDGPLDL